MQVVFRTDASFQLGTGHVMRCLTLADALRDRGGDCRFVGREHPGNLLDVIRERGYVAAGLRYVDDADRSASDSAHNNWLGADWETDASQTRAAIGDTTVDWLIVDHYSLDARWEQRMRPACRKLMVIDDVADRAHDCELLLDQNYSDDASRYDGLAPDAARVMLGPRYALLRPEYRQCHRERSEADPVRRVMVFLGGSDPDDVTGMALTALCEPQFAHLEVDILVGANYRHLANLESRVAARPRTHLHRPRTHLADLMAQADLAIGAGGVTTWERMCTGLPSIVITLAQNQVPACVSLSRRGAIHYLGERAQVAVADIVSALDRYLSEPQSLARMSAQGKVIVDGLGTSRICEMLMPRASAELTLRRATPADVGLYLDWANDREVRRQAFQSDPIAWDPHRQWFNARLASDHSHLFVMLAGELPVGQIRFDEQAEGMLIDYSIDAAFRGRGWARRIVELGVLALQRHARPVFLAEVKISNVRSAAVFSRLGFVERPGAERSARLFRFDASSQQLAMRSDQCAS